MYKFSNLNAFRTYIEGIYEKVRISTLKTFAVPNEPDLEKKTIEVWWPNSGARDKTVPTFYQDKTTGEVIRARDNQHQEWEHLVTKHLDRNYLPGTAKIVELESTPVASWAKCICRTVSNQIVDEVYVFVYLQGSTIRSAEMGATINLAKASI
jgi:hypothetical protein